MTKIYESEVEKFSIELLESQGYACLSPEEQEVERPDLSEVILKKRLRDAIERLNPNIPADAREYAFKEPLKNRRLQLIFKRLIAYTSHIISA